MQSNTATTTTTTETNIEKTQHIIKQRYNAEDRELDLSNIDVHSGGYKNDWRNVLQFRNWNTLRCLNLSKAGITQAVVILMILVPNC